MTKMNYRGTNMEQAYIGLLACCLANTDLIKSISDDLLLTSSQKTSIALLRSTVSKAPYSKITKSIFEMYKIDDQYLLRALETAQNELFNFPLEKTNSVFDNVFPYYKHKLGLAKLHHNAKQAMQACEQEDLDLAIKYMRESEVEKMYVPKSTKRQLLKVTEAPQLIKTGIDVIDKSGGWRRGNIVQITGDSGTMKTTCSLWICIKILLTNPEATVLYFEKEMPAEDVYNKITSHFIQMPLEDMDGMIKNGTGDVLSNMIEEKFNSPTISSLLDRLHVVANDEFNNGKDVVAIVRAFKPTVWVLDYLTALSEDEPGESSYDNMVFMMNGLKDITNRTKSIGIILSQLKSGWLNNKLIPIPNKSDIEWGFKANQYSAYLYTTFMPTLYTDLMPSNYFFLLPLKIRYGKHFTISLLSKPEFNDFKEPPTEIRDNMINQLKQFTKRKFI